MKECIFMGRVRANFSPPSEWAFTQSWEIQKVKVKYQHVFCYLLSSTYHMCLEVMESAWSKARSNCFLWIQAGSYTLMAETGESHLTLSELCSFLCRPRSRCRKEILRQRRLYLGTPACPWELNTSHLL